jgi:hypothetical protein
MKEPIKLRDALVVIKILTDAGFEDTSYVNDVFPSWSRDNLQVFMGDDSYSIKKIKEETFHEFDDPKEMFDFIKRETL